ncbi:MAG: hypothetical protein FWC06_06220 [Treponema sp.]|nr:hypothetical protein [Treponema sp.]
MKRILIIFILLSFTVPVFSQTSVSPWWLSLEYGKLRFRSGDYGNALMLFEDARRDRRAVYEQMERDLIHLLSLGDVRRIGDSLDRVEQYSYDRRYTAASAAFEELYYRIQKSSLNNSANAALAAIGKLKDYPEAEYWIGEVYRVEGELSLALSQYRRAYAMRENLEDSGFAVTLQYKIAGILRTRMEYNEMERTLLSIIDSLDTLWVNADRAALNNTGTTSIPYAQASASFARAAMTRTLENDGINRFLEMYRYNNSTVEQAHRLLGFHYVVAGRPSAQDHLMFAFLIQNTVIIEELMRRQFDFRFTTITEIRENQARSLIELSEALNKNHVLVSYIDEVEYYKTAYYLAASLYRNGKTTTALNIWSFLASQPRAGEWYSRAVNQLRSPHAEPIVEMP